MSMLQNNEISVVAFYCSAELLGLKLKKILCRWDVKFDIILEKLNPSHVLPHIIFFTPTKACDVPALTQLISATTHLIASLNFYIFNIF